MTLLLPVYSYVPSPASLSLVHFEPGDKATKFLPYMYLKFILSLYLLEPNRANGVKLTEKDLAHLMRQLEACSYKWNPIGLSLGFTQVELNTIFGMLKLLIGAPVSYLREILSQWVQWPTEEHQNIPTLGALCTALRSPLVGLGSLAVEVEKEMKQL